VEINEDPEDDDVRSECGLLVEDRLGPFFNSVGRSNEFACVRKKVATRCGILAGL
jgi:hypothetical protein